jgi:NitT/TauT family transport system permease protein
MIESLLLPTFSETAVALFHLVGTEALWKALWVSNQALVIGYAAALLAGLPIGVWMGASPVIGRIAGVYLTIMLMTPTAALIPLILIAVGLNTGARAIVVFLFSVPFVVLNTRAGMTEVDRSLVEMARAFCATRWQILWRAVIPATLPAMIVGARVGLSRAFTGMVMVELLLIAVGLGRLILDFQARYEAASLYAVIVVMLLEAALLMKATRWLEGYIMPWAGRA